MSRGNDIRKGNRLALGTGDKMRSATLITKIFLFLFLLFFHVFSQNNHPFTSIDDEQNYGHFIDTKCGFPLVLQAHSPANRDLLMKLTRIQLEQLPDDSIYISPSGHFKIFYDIQGYNTIPTYDRNQNKRESN